MSSTTLLKTDNSDNTLDHLNENFDDESKTLIPKQPPTSPSLRSDRTSEEVSSPPSSTHSSPQTVEIHPLDTNNESTPHTRESTTQSFHTANKPSGSQLNPINVRAHHELTCGSTWIQPAGILLLKTLTRIRTANFPWVIRLNRSGTCKMTDHLRIICS